MTEEQIATQITKPDLERGTDFLVDSNPEFQQKSAGVSGFRSPETLAFGTANDRSLALLRDL